MKKKKIIINGPNIISGDINISGSKNSALPILFSTLLSSENIKIKNLPNLKDINITIKLLKKIGVKIKKEKKDYIINSKYINDNTYQPKLINKIRASIWLVSPILIRKKKIKINKPGGCNIGKRPINLHIYVWKKFGSKININKKNINIEIKKKLTPQKIKFNKISVGATITTILLSILIIGTTIIYNCAQEPEIDDLINFLNKIGAKIKKNKNKIIIEGVKKLKGGKYTIISDRIETGTYLIAAAASIGKILCYNTNYFFLKSLIKKLKKCGAIIKLGNDFISLDMKNKRPNSLNIITNPYPHFPTDLQPQFTVLNCISNGNSIIKENIFTNRFSHALELKKMKANINIKNNILFCKGKKIIYGNKNINGTDLRSTISLIIAGCIAEGKTIINNYNYIYRGYENVFKKFKKLGINIKKI